MNAISNALIDLKFNIPLPVLNLAFAEVNGYRDDFTSLDDKIMSLVVRPKVLKDCNLVGGIEMIVHISNCEIRHNDEVSTVYYVPKEHTGGKSIISVLNLLQGTMFNRDYQNYFPSTIDTIAVGQNMMNNMANHSIVQTSRLELIGDNVVYVGIPTNYANYEYLRVNVENDVNLSNISPRNYLVFSQLVTLAVKAWIYNKMNIEMDKGVLYGGHELSEIKNIIDNYSDSYSEYLEKLQEWAKIAYMNDNTKFSRYIGSMFGNTV